MAETEAKTALQEAGPALKQAGTALKNEKVGSVVSTKMQKTIVVETTEPTFSFFNAVPACFNAVPASCNAVLASVSAIYFFSPANSRSRRMV